MLVSIEGEKAMRVEYKCVFVIIAEVATKL